MNKFILYAFFSFILFCSTAVFATTWSNNNWERQVIGCGDYNTSCDNCGDPGVVTDTFELYVGQLSEGKWLVNVYGENIKALETKCCESNLWNCGGSDCESKITEIGIRLVVEGTVKFSAARTGTWLLASGDSCQSNTNSQNLNPILSGQQEVICNKSGGCSMYYQWWMKINGWADAGTGTDYISGKATLDAKVEYNPGFGFTLSANPTSGTVTQGDSISTNVTATITPGAATQTITFSASGLPSGASVSFAPTTCSPTCTSTMTISTSASTPSGTYPITVIGTGGGATSNTTYSLTVNQQPAFDFSLSLDPSSGTVNKGNSTTATVTAKLLAGSTQSVSLSYTVQPTATGITASFNPTSLTPTSAGVNSTMTISVGSTASVGTYTITVKGTAGSLTRNATYTLTIPTCNRNNPAISVNPSTQSGTASSTLQYTVTVGNKDSGNDCTAQNFILSSACPSGWTCTFIQSTLSVAPGSTNSTTLNVTSPSIATGSNSFNIIATSGSYTNITSATYMVSPPCSGSVKLSFTPPTVPPSGSVAPDASGLTNCDGKKVEFRNKTCTGEKLRECTVSGTGCTGSPFTAPSSLGSYTYFACVDKNNDGDFLDEGESNSTVLMVSNVCPRDSPSITPDVSSITRQAGESYIFKITVKNEDYQTCSESTFKLSANCPTGWTCTFSSSSLSIAPKNSASANLTVKSSASATGEKIIDVTAINLGDSSYNKTISIGFNIGSRCDGASIRITDVSFSESGAKVTVENNGTANDLTIKSVLITDKSGSQYTNSSLSIGNFDVGDKEEIVLSRNIPKCEEFSKAVVNTDCPGITATFNQKARCLSVSTAIVKIKDARYENGMLKIVLKNDGSDSIISDAIGITINGEIAGCKETFTLSPKTTANCSIEFECTDSVMVGIAGGNETEIQCKPEIIITPNTCKDSECEQRSAVFATGESVYLDVKTDSGVDISASIYYNGEFLERIYPGDSYKPTKAGIYTINITASKEGYMDTVKKLTFTVEDKTGGILIKAGIILLFVVLLGGFILYRLKKTKKRVGFDELYEKYKKKQVYGELYKKYGKRKLRRRI